MRSKTYMSKINLQVETTNSGEQEEQREKTDMLRCPKSTEGTLLRISSNQRITEPKPISTEPYAASKLETQKM